MALCLAVKDQGRDMPEWLAWHRTLGIGRVYMFDMGSRPPMNQVSYCLLFFSVSLYSYLKSPSHGRRGHQTGEA